MMAPSFPDSEGLSFSELGHNRDHDNGREGDPLFFVDQDTQIAYLRPWAYGGSGGGNNSDDYESSIPTTERKLIRDENGKWVEVSKKKRKGKRGYKPEKQRRDKGTRGLRW